VSAGKDFAALIGRIMIAALYVPAGFSKIGGFSGTAGYIASKGLPLPEVGAAIAIVVELVAGLMLVVGWKTRWAALALAAFTLVASFIFHPYWQNAAEFNAFWKNIAVVGGLLLLYAFGPGRLSLDRS
jgi:putative oxidoreductase